MGFEFPTQISGDFHFELSESLEDVPNVVEANYVSGTVTVYVCPSATVIILPIVVVSFNGEILEESNRLFWTTENESNSEWQGIERSVNGIDHWMETGRIVSQSVNQGRTDYELYDDNPLHAGYYRLYEIDYDGNKTNYETIYLKRGNSDMNMSTLKPNPAMNLVSFDLWMATVESVEIHMVDLWGKIIHVESFSAQEGYNEISLETGKINGWHVFNHRIFTTRYNHEAIR